MDKELLFKSRLEEREVEIAGVGTVRVRALTRAEAIKFKGDHDAEELEVKMLSIALLDPVLTESEVRQWQETSPVGELQQVVDVIVDLSGMRKEVGKENFRQFRE